MAEDQSKGRPLCPYTHMTGVFRVQQHPYQERHVKPDDSDDKYGHGAEEGYDRRYDAASPWRGQAESGEDVVGSGSLQEQINSKDKDKEDTKPLPRSPSFEILEHAPTITLPVSPNFGVPLPHSSPAERALPLPLYSTPSSPAPTQPILSSTSADPEPVTAVAEEAPAEDPSDPIQQEAEVVGGSHKVFGTAGPEEVGIPSEENMNKWIGILSQNPQRNAQVRHTHFQSRYRHEL